MPVPNFGGLPPYPSFEDVTDKVNKLVNELRNLLLNLDTLNIAELNAKVIIAGTVTAEKISVNELSALSANLGHITAGLIEAVEIFGSYIATSQSYPRAEMSSTSNLFGAYQDANNYVAIKTIADEGAAPGVVFKNNVMSGQMSIDNNQFEMRSIGGALRLRATGDIYLGDVLSSNINVINWERINGLTNGQTLQGALDEKANSGVVTHPNGAHNHGIPDGTKLMVSGGGTVTYTSAPSHTHIQS